jgi:hypothetical protein
LPSPGSLCWCGSRLPSRLRLSRLGARLYLELRDQELRDQEPPARQPG